MWLRIHAPSRPAVARRLAVVLAFGLVGCTPAEQVTRYTAPKDPNDQDVAAEEPAPGDAKVRILGAIAPAGDEWYFFKFQGPNSTDTYPPKLIEPHAAEFDAFLQSLKFPANGPPTWTLPPGWEQVNVKSAIQRIATFQMKSGDTNVDLAVSQARGELLANVNRWRGQAGVKPVTGAEIETKCRVLTVDGRRVVVVDVSGPGGKGGGMMPPFAK